MRNRICAPVDTLAKGKGRAAKDVCVCGCVCATVSGAGTIVKYQLRMRVKCSSVEAHKHSHTHTLKYISCSSGKILQSFLAGSSRSMRKRWSSSRGSISRRRRHSHLHNIRITPIAQLWPTRCALLLLTNGIRVLWGCEERAHVTTKAPAAARQAKQKGNSNNRKRSARYIFYE